jgi:hypothetical protein
LLIGPFIEHAAGEFGTIVELMEAGIFLEAADSRSNPY